MKLKHRIAVISISIALFLLNTTFDNSFNRNEEEEEETHDQDADTGGYFIHVAFFRSEFENEDISLLASLALKCAKLHGKPDKLIVHYNKMPHGPNFDDARPFIDRLRKVKPPNQVFGIDVLEPAHVKDVFLMETLKRYGGVFIDMDIFVLQNLRAIFDSSDFAMGRQSDTRLLNALTMAQKNSTFLTRWYENYKTFNGSLWDYHSCQIPNLFSQQYPNEINVIAHEKIVKPGPSHAGLKMALLDRTHNYEKNYATHLWSHMNRRLLSNLTKSKILTIDNSFFCKIRHLVDQNAEKCKVLNTKVQGVIGNWTKLGEQIPKIQDFSTVQYHGSFSPLNGFEMVNPTAVKDYENGMLKLRGDHIYLPILANTIGNGFQLQIQVAFPISHVKICPVLSIESMRRELLILKHKVDNEFHHFELIHRHRNGKYTIEPIIEVQVPKDSISNQPVNISIVGGKEELEFIAKVSDQSAERKVKGPHLGQLSSIWIAMEPSSLASDGPLQVYCFFDIKSVILTR